MSLHARGKFIVEGRDVLVVRTSDRCKFIFRYRFHVFQRRTWPSSSVNGSEAAEPVPRMI